MMIPQSNQDTISLPAYLKTAVCHGRLSHAYLIETPNLDLGLALAYQFAQLLLCEKQTGCGDCQSCGMVQHRTHPDMHVVSLPEYKKQITVAQIREVVQESYVKPYLGHRRVVLFTDGGAMTVQAQNALLKVLEEPPGDVVFLILCTNHMNLLETVRSRTTLLPFQQKQISSVNSSLDEDEKDTLFSLAQRMADGRLLDIYTVSEYFGVRDRKKRKDKTALAASFDYLLSIFREILFIQFGCGDLIAPPSALLEQLARQTPTGQVIRIMEQLSLAVRRLDRNVQYDLLIMSLLYSCAADHH